MTNITDILQSPQFRAAQQADATRAAAWLQAGIADGSIVDNRMPSVGRGTQMDSRKPGGRPILENLNPINLGYGISNSAARTVAGTSDLLGRKLLGEGADPALLAALQPRPNELLGNALGDMGQMMAGSAALKIPMLGGDAPGFRAALTRAIGQGGKAALESGALTGLQSGGDAEAMARDAKAAGLIGGGLSFASSALKDGGKWLASKPFKITSPEEEALFQRDVLPKMLSGYGPPGIKKVAAGSFANEEALTKKLGAAYDASPPMPIVNYTNPLNDARLKFAFAETPVKPQMVNNPNFWNNPVREDLAIKTTYRPIVNTLDKNVVDVINTKGPGGIPLKNVSDQRHGFDKAAQDSFKSGLEDATPRVEVNRAYGDALRRALHEHDNGALSPLMTQTHEAKVASDIMERALKGDAGTGGSALRGSDFRKVQAVNTLLGRLDPRTVAIGSALAAPAATGWTMNRAGQIANLLSSAPAVRAIQDTTTKPKKKN